LELLVAAAEAGPNSVRQRLEAIRALYGEDIGIVEEELARSVRSGVSPGTDSAVHLLEAGGKRVRPLTVILSAACFGAPGPAARSLGVVAELVHLATLLHDDVIDDGQQRRGKPTARSIWGNAVSVLSGDMLLTEALERTASLGLPSVLTDLFATLRRLVEGEILQLSGRTALDVDEATYFRVVRDKTGSLFEWAARSGAVCAGAPQGACRALGTFGARMGLAFQLVDDVLDYAGDANSAGKALFADLREGKITLPLIRALAVAPSLRKDVDASRRGDVEAALRVATAVQRSDACDAVRAIARPESNRALDALAVLPASAARDMLGAIARELVGRVA
jgi:octaprenyl-diphosphate synthase